MRNAINQFGKVFVSLSVMASVVAGCTRGHHTIGADVSAAPRSTQSVGHVLRVIRSTYNTKSKTVELYLGKVEEKGPAMDFSREDLIDPNGTDGIINYAYSQFPNESIREVTIHDATAPGHKVRKAVQVSSVLSSTNPTGLVRVQDQASALAANSRSDMSIPPSGVTMDRSSHPIAGVFDSSAKKTQAILNVARSLLGTPCIWGHNRDRGQYGFDDSNFTAYVYHHALGYHMTTLSKAQCLYVGEPVPKNQMQPGDLLIFDNGRHVGIYVGSHRMVEGGGGMGRVSYLSVAPGSYWGNHLTTVKRMF